jgi:hypothetical protein
LILNPNVLISLNMTHTKINTYINSIWIKKSSGSLVGYLSFCC